MNLGLEVKLFHPRSKMGSWKDLEASSRGSREMDGSRVEGGSRGELSPFRRRMKHSRKVKSQHLSLSQLLQVRGSFPRLSAGVRHWGGGGKAVRVWGLGCRDGGAQGHSGTATPELSGTMAQLPRCCSLTCPAARDILLLSPAKAQLMP